ncbi:MAG: hypothetical protein AAFY33_11370 [Cyanobacteria bacterium J06643_4]
MTQSPSFPIPELAPLTRLNIHDKLRINAERWALAHDYHRQRQNIHYQALWQPGIVYGLGVKKIVAPAKTAQKFQDDRWLEIQPGLAIDSQGNPIVVKESDDRTYHLARPNLTQSLQTLYLSLSYVNPENLEFSEESDRIQEQFRFNQYIDHIDRNDIELCRVVLTQQNGSIGIPEDPLNPSHNQLDLRFRSLAEQRSPKWITLGYIGEVKTHTLDNIAALLAAMPGLYPQMQGRLERTTLFSLPIELRRTVDVAYLNASTLVQWYREADRPSLNNIKQYLLDGGALIVEAPAITDEIDKALQFLKRGFNRQQLPKNHAIRQTPFLFGQWPPPSGYAAGQSSEQSYKQLIDLFYDDGIAFLKGPVTDSWRGESLPRHEIRTHQECGINLLHHLWTRRHLRTLLS